MTRSRAFLPGIRLVVASLATFSLWQASGCGGVVAEGDGDGGAGGDGGGGSGQGGSGVSGSGTGGTSGKGGATRASGGAGGKATPARCGNGIVDGAEECDGSSLDGQTCASFSGGAASGTLLCTARCQFDTSYCIFGAGGASVGGSTGSGAVPGAGGGPTDPATACYLQGGVYAPGSGCYFGTDGQQVCRSLANKVSSPNAPTCHTSCGCDTCAGDYARCLSDGGCAFILACSDQSGCRSLDDCMKTGCSYLVDRAGGYGSVGAQLFDRASACREANYNCRCDILL